MSKCRTTHTQNKGVKPLGSRMLSLLLSLVLAFGLLPALPATAMAEGAEDIGVEALLSDGGAKIGTVASGDFSGSDVYFKKLDRSVAEIANSSTTYMLYSDWDCNYELGGGGQFSSWGRDDNFCQAAMGTYSGTQLSLGPVSLSESADHLLVIAFHQQLETVTCILVEWDKGEIGKGVLAAAIDSVPTSGYYTENDRFNGKTTSENGFWADMQTALAEARSVMEKASASQHLIDATAENLNAAIANLIPVTQVNPTALYEELGVEWCLNSATGTVGGVKPKMSYDVNPTLISADSITAATWQGYSDARDAAQALLDGLFDGDGAPTAANTSERQTEIDSAISALQESARKMVDKSLYEQVYAKFQNSRDEINALLALYDPAKMTAGDYTAESWAALIAAHAALESDMAYRIVGGTYDDMVMLRNFGGWGEYIGETRVWHEAHIEALRKAYAALESGVDITVSFEYVSNFDPKYNGTDTEHEYMGTYAASVAEMGLPAGSTTAAAALAQAGIKYDTRGNSGFATNS